MNQKLTILFLLIISQVGFGQSDLCNAVIYWKHEGVVKIFDEPNGSELISLQNNIKTENHLSLKIKKKKGNYFYVEIKTALSDKTYDGWIENQEYVGAFMKHEKEYMDLVLYSSPELPDTEKIEIKHWKSGFVSIELCGDKWTKVSISHKGQRITGWIESIKLCANNYSTCS